MKDIIVSIVVPVYNTSKYLDQCLSSLVNQTLKDIEIICVNDASTDNSLELLTSWAEKDNRIIVVDSKVNLRQGGARNIGIRRAKGKYIGLVDSDDYVDVNMYESLVNHSNGCTSDIVVSNLYATYSKDIVHIRNFDTCQGPVEYRKSVLLNGWAMVTSIMKKSLFEDNDLWYPERLSFEDNAITAPLFLSAKNINVLYNEKPFYFYRISNQSTTRSKDNPHCWDRLITADLFLENTKRLNQYELYEDEILYSHYRLYIINSFRYAIFAFSSYQYERVKKIVSEYDKQIGLKTIRNNPYYRTNRTAFYRISNLICTFPLAGYVIWAYSYVKNKLSSSRK